jgi:hypothetical protein
MPIFRPSGYIFVFAILYTLLIYFLQSMFSASYIYADLHAQGVLINRKKQLDILANLY